MLPLIIRKKEATHLKDTVVVKLLKFYENFYKTGSVKWLQAAEFLETIAKKTNLLTTDDLLLIDTIAEQKVITEIMARPL